MNKDDANSLQLFDTYLQIKLEDSEKIFKFFYVWLRDHCKCSYCYNDKTCQTFVDVLNIPLNIRPSSCEIIADDLKIMWKDGHKTEFPLIWLKGVEFPMKVRTEVIFWNRGNVSNFEDMYVPIEIYLKNNDGAKLLLKSLLKYGVGFVTGVESTLEATVKVVEHIAPLQKTFFGETWTVSNDYFHNDTAYTNTALSSHTDNTYFTEAAGLQIFHMLSHEGSGGETLLVDGFSVANKLRRENKKAFDILCATPIESHYIEEKYYFNNIEVVIQLHPVTNELYQIRYNKYDRSTFNSVAEDKILQFYEAYQIFGKEVMNRENEFQIKLRPGSVLFIDNWRVLHGRNAYTGKRNLSGCYITRAEWRSRAKSLGLDIL